MRERAIAAVPLAARSPAAWCFNWLEIKDRLKIAAGLAQLGGTPLMQRFHGIKRRIALAASRVVLYLTRFLTSRQTDFNICLLDILREMGEALHIAETRLIQQQEQIRLLETTINQLQMRMSARCELERKAS
jgi:hypothetical protein